MSAKFKGRILIHGSGTVHGDELATLIEELAPEAEVVEGKGADLVFFELPTTGQRRFLAELQRRFGSAQLVALIPAASVDALAQLMRAGVADYVVASSDDNFARQVSEALARAAASIIASSGSGLGATRDFRELGLIGRSRVIRETFAFIRKAAESNVTVLVAGESGTGKELVARAVHQFSPRRGHAFVPVNCGAIPRPLLESELFGHVRGAFSGAVEDKIGLLAEAEGGTLFLDEICDLPLDMQVKINRVLQERELRRLGDTVERKVDVRFVAASNKNFEEEIRTGRFREDLFFRLNVLRIDLPPLRERSRDVVHLAEFFVKRYSEREGKVIEGITPLALKALLSYHWPGNVRELENSIERAVLLANGTQIAPEDLPAEIPTLQTRRGGFAPNYALPYSDAIARLTQEASIAYIEEILSRFGGNVTQAARHAELPRESLHRLIRKFGVRRAAPRGSERP